MSTVEIPESLAGEIRVSRSVAVLTGSGVSAQSGVPTFREAQTGMWERFDPRQLATPDAFQRDPKLVWEWYAWRRELVQEAQPNPGHHALAELERRVPEFTLITQNVDSLHGRAGSENVLDLHGNITRSKCSAEDVAVEPPPTDEAPPPCPNCGAPLRPDVVWFGEMLPQDALMRASEATRSCDVFLSIGTSSLVYPAASLPFEALEGEATVVEINPDETPLTPEAHFALRGPAGEVLPELVRAAYGA